MEKAYILTTGNITNVDEDLIPNHRIELASANKTRGRIPEVPILEDQKDLTKLVAILLSTGINRNDDVFLPSEILPVRNTGAHKPVNLEHSPDKIIGHMIRTFATEKDGNRVPDNKNPINRSFDITAEAVIYSFLFPDLVRDIKNRANSNNLFVSVEVWFTAFDFLVGKQIVERNPQTASRLEGRLKVNGGSGSFEGQRLGRVLRNIIIGGIGVVKDPANPESIIKSISNFNSEVVKDIEDKVISEHILYDFNYLSSNDCSIKESNMNEDLIEEMATLASAIKAKSESESETEEVQSTSAAEIDIPEDSEEFRALAARIDKLERSNKELAARADEAEFKAEASRRSSRLARAGIPDEMIERHMSRCFRMTKDQFDEYVGLLVDTLNGILTTRASTGVIEQDQQVEVEETNEGGDVADTEVESESQENNEVQENETESVDEEEEPQAAIEDEVEIDIEAVDPNINIEGQDNDSQPSTTDIMGDVIQKFLKSKNPKWEKLAINN